MAIEEQKILSYLLQKKDNYTNHRKYNYDNLFLENYRLYKSYRDPQLHVWQTNIFVPYVFSMIETVLPRIVEYLWQGDKFVTTVPRDSMDDPGNAKIIDDLVNWQTDSQIENLFLEWVEMFKTYMIQGTGIGKITWDVLKDKPTFMNVDIFDMFVQPGKKYIDQMDGVFHVFDLPADIVQAKGQLGAGYKNLEGLAKTSMGTKDEEGDTVKDAEVGRVRNYEPNRKTSLIYQYWGKVPVQDSITVGIPQLGNTTYQEKLCEIANRNTLIRVSDNPYATEGKPEGMRPFVVAKNYLDPGEFYGIGDISPIKDVQYEMNEIENSDMDNIKLAMNKMWLVGGTAGVDISNMVSYPGNVITANDPSQITPLEHKPGDHGAAKKLEHLKGIIDGSAGVFDYTKGANTPGMTDTVGGITSLIQEANARFSYKIKVLQMTAIKGFAEKLFHLDQMFIKGVGIPVRISNEEGFRWLNVNPDNIQGMYNFKPVSVSMIGNKLAKQNAMIRLLEVISKSPPLPSFIKAMMESFDLENKEEVMQELMQMWGIAQQGQGGPPGVPSPTRQGGSPVNDAQVGQNLSNQMRVGR